MGALNPAWFTEKVVLMAKVCRGNPSAEPPVPAQPDKRPILADALEESGCDDAELLDRLRTGKALDGWNNPIRELAETSPESHVELWTRHIEWKEREAKRKTKEEREAKYASARSSIAVALGNNWHERVGDLFQSAFGKVVYGRGGQEDYCYPYRGSYKTWKARWKNAGARIVGYAKSGRVVLENTKGKEVARLPVPPKKAKFERLALCGGDLFFVPRRVGKATVAVRYGVSRVKDREYIYRKTGVAVLLTVPTELRGHGPFYSSTEQVWEHGLTVKACREEWDHKLKMAMAKREEYLQRVASEKERAEADRKLNRKIKLLTVIGKNTMVGYDDARACGMCDAGIRGFAARAGLEVTEQNMKELRLPLTLVSQLEPSRGAQLARLMIERRANGR